MASQPMTNTSQDNNLSISHTRPPSTSIVLENRQRSVGTQAKIGAPLKIISPRPWKSATTPAPTPEASAPSTPATPSSGKMTPSLNFQSSRSSFSPFTGASQALVSTVPTPLGSFSSCVSSRPPSVHSEKPKSVIEEDHSYYICSSPEQVTDQALLEDEKVIDGVKFRSKLSKQNSLKLVMQKDLSSDKLQVCEMTFSDGSKNKSSFQPKEAMKALKRKRKQKSWQVSFIAPLDGQGQVFPAQDQFVNEVHHPQEPCKDSKSISIKEEPQDSEEEDKDEIIYELSSEDGFRASSNDINKLWMQIFDAVNEARLLHGLNKANYSNQSRAPVNEIGLQMLGLTHSAVQYLIEQLPGAKEAAEKYKFKHHTFDDSFDNEFQNEVLKENPSGTARGESFKERRPRDMFSWLASRHRKRPNFYQAADADVQMAAARRATSLDLPMAMRFRHLAKNAKEAVGVYTSVIHGRGLFCKREIQAGEMVIEYAGELIRAMLTDKREKYYESRGIGCYMFKIDDDTVVDATMKGNAARFINHSCDPNCYSKIVDIFGKKHIIIFALRRIIPGEELTYDYKFPIEDVKIPCACSARRCRKYMN